MDVYTIVVGQPQTGSTFSYLLASTSVMHSLPFVYFHNHRLELSSSKSVKHPVLSSSSVPISIVQCPFSPTQTHILPPPKKNSLVNELSTPFLNTMHFLKDANVPKTSAAVKVNQMLFAVVFFCCRVVVDLYIIYALLNSDAVLKHVCSWLYLGYRHPNWGRHPS